MIYGNTFLKEEYGYEVNISAKDVNKLLNEISNITLLESEYSDLPKIDDISFCNEQVLFESTGINKEDIQKKAKPAATKIAKIIKDEGITEESKKSIKRVYDDFITEISKSIDLNIEYLCKVIGYKPGDNKYDISKIAKAVELMLFVLACNTILVTVVSILIPIVGYFVFAIIIGPIIEETAKATAIKGGYATEFTVIFNAYELTTYVTKFGQKITDRLKVVAMHCTTTIIQYLTTNEKVQQKLKMTSEKDKEKLVFIGRLAGMLIHIGWNGHATFKVVKQIKDSISQVMSAFDNFDFE